MMNEGDSAYSSGVTLRFPKLNDRNYRGWKFDMGMFLHERGLFGFVDALDPEKEPTSAEELVQPGLKRQYKTRASRALATIALGLEADLKPLIRNSKTALDAWEVLASVRSPNQEPVSDIYERNSC